MYAERLIGVYNLSPDGDCAYSLEAACRGRMRPEPRRASPTTDEEGLGETSKLGGKSTKDQAHLQRRDGPAFGQEEDARMPALRSRTLARAASQVEARLAQRRQDDETTAQLRESAAHDCS